MKKYALVATAFGLFLWWGSQKMIENIRGIRNKNPGNIERGSDQWLGMAAEQTDSRFLVFESPEYGIRAIARILQSYERRNVVTVTQIINTWAPAVENDTQSYIDSVGRSMGVDVNQRLTIADYPELIAAIIKHENGINPYSDVLIEQGIALA